MEYKELNSLSDISDYDGTLDSIKTLLTVRMFNVDNMPSDKEDIAYKQYGNFALVLSVEEKVLKRDDYILYEYTFTNEDIKNFEITFEELYDKCTSNMNTVNSYRIESLSQYITRGSVFDSISQTVPGMCAVKSALTSSPSPFGRSIGEMPNILDDDEKHMIVVSNRRRMFGAVNILMPEVIEEIYKKFKSNYYIIPTSIHEAICVNSKYYKYDCKSNEKEQDYKDLLEYINDVITHDQRDILSYNIYYMSHDENVIAKI